MHRVYLPSMPTFGLPTPFAVLRSFLLITFYSKRMVVVLTLTHHRNTMQPVVAGQAPVTLEWK